MQERPIEAKIADVERQLACGDAIIVFDIDAGTTKHRLASPLGIVTRRTRTGRTAPGREVRFR
jgi:hypothetical protein